MSPPRLHPTVAWESIVSPAPGRGGAEGNHPGLGAGGRVTGLCVWGGCGGWKQFEEKLPSGRSLSTSPQAFRKALWLSPKPGTQKSQGFRFLSVILASLLSGSIDDVLGDLLGDDSKCRLTRVGGGRKPDHLSSTQGPTGGKERISLSSTKGSCFDHTHQCLFPNFGFHLILFLARQPLFY